VITEGNTRKGERGFAAPASPSSIIR